LGLETSAIAQHITAVRVFLLWIDERQKTLFATTDCSVSCRKVHQVFPYVPHSR